MLEVDSIRVQAGSHAILNRVSFTAERGSILGIIGPNGAGKTTLVRAVSGVVPLSEGQVRVQGRDLQSLKPAERARQIAVVPQARNLPPSFTGWELVILGRTPHLNWLGHVSTHDETCVWRALERVQALDLAERRLGELSGGEQQRLLLARALAQEAPILLLDEPTTHLDLHYQISLLDTVRELALNEGLAVVVVLHDLNLVGRYADRVGLLVKGELKAVGSPAEVLQPAVLGPAYGLPLQVLQNPNTGGPVILPAVL